jgi:hypothetical protein
MIASLMSGASVKPKGGISYPSGSGWAADIAAAFLNERYD